MTRAKKQSAKKVSGTSVGKPDVLLLAAISSAAAVRLMFADGEQFSVTPESLGIDQRRFNLATARLTEGGGGLELLRKGHDEWVVFDAASLRSRVDPAYARRVREKLDTLDLPKSSKLSGKQPPESWYAEDQSAL